MKLGSMPLTTGPIARTLFYFTLPILMGNVLQSVNGSINAIWVGKFLGEAALTATSNGNIVMFLLLGAVFGITMASSILVAQYIGGKRVDAAKRVVGTSTTFFAVLSIALAVFGLIYSHQILQWMQTPPDALPLADAYLRWMFVGLPFSYGYFFLMAVLRGAGDSKTPFTFSILQVVLDIALNPLLIFGWGPVPALGIAGSALATLFAQAISLSALLFSVYRNKHPLALHANELQYLRIDWSIIKTLIVKGIPMGLQMIVLSFSMLVVYKLVNHYGTETTAAFAAAMQLWNYVQMPAMAIGGAVSSMAAQNIGAGLWDRVGKIAKAGVAFNFLMCGVPVILIYAINRYALQLFLPATGNALEIAHHLNALVLWSYPLFGVAMVLGGVMRASGAVFVPLITLFIAMILVRIPLAYLLSDRFGADGIWWSFSISALVAAAITLGYYKFGSWRSARFAPASPGAKDAAESTTSVANSAS